MEVNHHSHIFVVLCWCCVWVIVLTQIHTLTHSTRAGGEGEGRVAAEEGGRGGCQTEGGGGSHQTENDGARCVEEESEGGTGGRSGWRGPVSNFNFFFFSPSSLTVTQMHALHEAPCSV